MTIGTMVRQLLTKLDWYDSLFPRIPVPIQVFLLFWHRVFWMMMILILCCVHYRCISIGNWPRVSLQCSNRELSSRPRLLPENAIGAAKNLPPDRHPVETVRARDHVTERESEIEVETGKDTAIEVAGIGNVIVVITAARKETKNRVGIATGAEAETGNEDANVVERQQKQKIPFSFHRFSLFFSLTTRIPTVFLYDSITLLQVWKVLSSNSIINSEMYRKISVLF